MSLISSDTARECLRRVIAREISITVKPGTQTWGATWDGDVTFLAGGFEFTFHYDCGSLDYTVNVRRGDLETAQDQWGEVGGDPLWGYSQEELESLEVIFKGAR